MTDFVSQILNDSNTMYALILGSFIGGVGTLIGCYLGFKQALSEAFGDREI